MSAGQNLSYAAIQVVHNLGAVAVVGGSLGGALVGEKTGSRKLAYLALAGWLTQAASGATFGIVTYHYHQQLPDIAGTAAYALGIKMVCVTLGTLMLAAYLWHGQRRTGQSGNRVLLASSALALTALSAAAFLRWYS